MALFVYVAIALYSLMIMLVITAALDEARDINAYLRPLSRIFDDLEQEELPDMMLMIAPMLHTIGLLWGASKYYSKPGRIIVLLQVATITLHN